MKILVAGVGDRLMGDDGIGPAIIEELNNGRLPDGVDAVDYGTSLMSLLHDLPEYDALIVIDALDLGGEPGEVRVLRITPEDLAGVDKAEAASMMTLSYHEADLDSVLSMAKELGILPKRVFLVGVHPARVELSLDLSETARESLPKAIESIKRLVAELTEGADS